jgi:hypothetical protein
MGSPTRAAEHEMSVSQTFKPGAFKGGPGVIDIRPTPGTQYYKWQPGERVLITDGSGVKYVATVSDLFILPPAVRVTDVRPYVEPTRNAPSSHSARPADAPPPMPVLNGHGTSPYFSPGDFLGGVDAGLKSGAAAALTTFVYKGIYDSTYRAKIERHQEEMAAIDRNTRTSAAEMSERAGADASMMSQALDNFDEALGSGATVTEFPRVYKSTAEKRGLGEDDGRRVYRSPTDPSSNLVTEFAFPTKNRYAQGFGDAEGIVGGPGAAAQIRTPGKPTNTPSVFNRGDTAGGTFTSGRSDGVGPVAREAYGRDARRLHAALDFNTRPGDAVYAPMNGTIVSIKSPDKFGLQQIYIKSPDGVIAGVLYTKPIEGLATNARVSAGVTQIGTAQDISKKYGASTPNHIHVQFEDMRGWRFDPWTNQYAQPMPPKPAP